MSCVFWGTGWGVGGRGEGREHEWKRRSGWHRSVTLAILETPKIKSPSAPSVPRLESTTSRADVFTMEATSQAGRRFYGLLINHKWDATADPVVIRIVTPFARPQQAIYREK